MNQADPRAMPEQIGRFRVTGKLGEGGIGVVYEAVDDRLGRTIALKVIRQDATDRSVASERFWREARIAARINHPHVCHLYEVGEADQQLFIAMEARWRTAVGAPGSRRRSARGRCTHRP